MNKLLMADTIWGYVYKGLHIKLYYENFILVNALYKNYNIIEYINLMPIPKCIDKEKVIITAVVYIKQQLLYTKYTDKFYLDVILQIITNPTMYNIEDTRIKCIDVNLTIPQDDKYMWLMANNFPAGYWQYLLPIDTDEYLAQEHSKTFYTNDLVDSIYIQSLKTYKKRYVQTNKFKIVTVKRIDYKLNRFGELYAKIYFKEKCSALILDSKLILKYQFGQGTQLIIQTVPHIMLIGIKHIYPHKIAITCPFCGNRLSITDTIKCDNVKCNEKIFEKLKYFFKRIKLKVSTKQIKELINKNIYEIQQVINLNKFNIKEHLYQYLREDRLYILIDALQIFSFNLEEIFLYYKRVNYNLEELEKDKNLSFGIKQFKEFLTYNNFTIKKINKKVKKICFSKCRPTMEERLALEALNYQIVNTVDKMTILVINQFLTTSIKYLKALKCNAKIILYNKLNLLL